MSRSRDIADAGVKVNYLDNVTANIPADVTSALALKAPLASPTFTGTTDISSGATLPAGHVVQTTVPVRNDTYTTYSGNDTWDDTVITGTIDPLYSNSAILIHATFGAFLTETSGNCGFGIRVKRSGTGVTYTYGSPLMGPTILDQGYSFFYRNGFQYAELVQSFSLNQVDDDCETTNTITYLLQSYTYNVEGFKIGGNGWDNSQWKIWFQEIKR